MPFPLQYAATANIVLTEFKLADHCKDSQQRRWQLLLKLLRSPFQKAHQKLLDWKFPLSELQTLNDEQDQREEILRAKSSRMLAHEALEFAAVPTAKATALFFRHGVQLLASPSLAASAYQLGYAFGRLIYLLDAFEDYEKDYRSREFNAIRAAYQMTEPQLSGGVRQQVRQTLLLIQEQIIATISTLPLQPATASIFINRLRQNVKRKLQKDLPVMSCARRAITMRERWRNALQTSRRLVHAELAKGTFVSRLYAPFMFAIILVVVLLAPSQPLQTWRDCLGLSANLMFWGAIPGAILAALKPHSPLMEINSGQKKHQKSQYCDSCCDPCCEGCCDGSCNCCCESCCDGCDCGCDC